MRALVVGASHIDIFADVDEGESRLNHIDKRGSFCISLGGTASNVAVALSYLKVNTTLVTALPRDRLFTLLARHCLKKMHTKFFVEQIDGAKDAGFVAIRNTGELLFAVNSCPVENFYINPDRYLHEIDRANAVVLDLNNSIDTVNAFLLLTPPEKTYILGVSEIKVQKLKDLQTDVVFAVFLNDVEFDAVKSLGVTDSLNTQWFVTTKKGVWYIKEKTSIFYPANLSMFRDGSFSGCGDSFAAGCIYGFMQRKTNIEKIVNNAFLLVKFTILNESAQITSSSISLLSGNSLFRDGLTGLLTRGYLEEEKTFFEGFAKRYNTPFSIILIDIDHFKKINDTYGHSAGDEVLRLVGSLIANSIRKSDLAVRYGGEELMILLPNTPEQKAGGVAEYLRKKIADFPVKHNDVEIYITASFGVASGMSVDSTIRNADAALYRAKKGGRNRVELHSAGERGTTHDPLAEVVR